MNCLLIKEKLRSAFLSLSDEDNFYPDILDYFPELEIKAFEFSALIYRKDYREIFSKKISDIISLDKISNKQFGIILGYPNKIKHYLFNSKWSYSLSAYFDESLFPETPPIGLFGCREYYDCDEEFSEYERRANEILKNNGISELKISYSKERIINLEDCTDFISINKKKILSGEIILNGKNKMVQFLNTNVGRTIPKIILRTSKLRDKEYLYRYVKLLNFYNFYANLGKLGDIKSGKIKF